MSSEYDLGGELDINIFYLDHDPRVAAQAHCDRHVVKMILETAQLLSTAWHELAPGAIEWSTVCTDPLYPYDVARLTGPGMQYYLNGQRIYGSTHKHHPSAVWARESAGNYDWLWRLGVHLLDEYSHRYRGRQHASRHVLRTLELPPPGLAGAQSEPPPAMPEEYVTLDAEGYVDAVASYRAYYRGAKRLMLTYTRRAPPAWCSELSTHKESAAL